MDKKYRAVRQHARARERKFRAIAFIVIGTGVLGLAGYFLVTAFFKPGPPPMAGNVIDVQADMGGFDLKLIRVQAGQPVTIRLTSLDNSLHTDGGGKHQWAVDELEVSIVAPAEGLSYATFTPDRSGTYIYYCDICCGGRANPTMQGTLMVEG